MKRYINVLAIAVIILTVSVAISAAPSVDALLTSKTNASPLSLTPVIITFDHQPGAADLAMLSSLGIRGGRYLSQLPIVLTSVNRVQFNALKAKPGIRSLYANRTFRLLDREGRTITGIENLIRDMQVTSLNQGMPVDW